MTEKHIRSLEEISRNVKLLRAEGRHPEAVDVIQSEIEAAAQRLADLTGMLAGTKRHSGDLIGAIQDYDYGFQLEQRYGFHTTYNQLNRLLTRIQLAPKVLADAEALGDAVDVVEGLKAVQRDLLASEAPDYWAMNDLAVVSALLEDQPSVDAALQALGSEDVPKWVYDAYVKTTADLAKLAIDSKGSVGALHAAFEDRATA